MNSMKQPTFDPAEHGLSHCTPQIYRKVMGCFPTGVTVMTLGGQGDPKIGVTVSSFNTVSMEPPLILWSLALDAPSLEAFRAHDHFAVNILGKDQQDIALNFARPAENKFDGVATHLGMTGAPLIEGAMAHIECRIVARHAGGDHEIMLGEVLGLRRNAGDPLVFCGGAFRDLHS